MLKTVARGTAVNPLTDFQNYKDDIKVFRSGLYIFNQDHTFVGDIRHFWEQRWRLAHRLAKPQRCERISWSKAKSVLWVGCYICQINLIWLINFVYKTLLARLRCFYRNIWGSLFSHFNIELTLQEREYVKRGNIYSTIKTISIKHSIRIPNRYVRFHPFLNLKYTTPRLSFQVCLCSKCLTLS